MRLVLRVAVLVGLGCVGFLATGPQVLAHGGATAPTPLAAPSKVRTIEEGLLAAVKVLTDTKPTPSEGTTINASKSNTFRTVRLDELSVPLVAKSVHSQKSADARIRGSDVRNRVALKVAPPKAIATYIKADAASQPLLQTAKGEREEAPVGTLTIGSALLFLIEKPITLAAGTYRVNLLDAKHHKEAGRTEAIIEIQGLDGTTVVAIFVNATALATQLAVPPDMQQYAEVWPNAVLLNLANSMLVEPTPPERRPPAEK